MIYKKCVMTIDKNKATLDEDIYLYRLDKNIELYFTIVNNKYRFNKGDMNNIILITNASFFQVRLYKNAEIKYTFAIQPTDGGQAILTITDDLIDDPIEVGDYDFQISLLDEEKTSMISMPIVSKQLHVCEPLVSDDATMGKAILGLSKLATGEIKNAFDSDGNYVREIHKDGDILSASIINKFEEALDTNTKAIKSGTGTPYDDTQIKTDINTIKTDLGTETLNTTAKDIKGAVNEVAAQYKDIVKQAITNEERTKLTNLKNYDDSSIKNDIQTQKARIDSFTSLKEGSTTGDAELIDSRVGATTIKYSSVGEAIREQIEFVYGKFELITTTMFQGSLASVDGNLNPSRLDRIASDFLLITDIGYIEVDEGYELLYMEYDKNKKYVYTSSFLGTGKQIKFSDLNTNNKYIRFSIRNAINPTSNITPTDTTGLKIIKRVSVEALNDEVKAGLNSPFSKISSNIEVEKIIKVPVPTRTGCCVVENNNKVQLWIFATSTDDGTGYADLHKLDLDIENGTLTLSETIKHNLGHCNSVEYCSETDTLILGNGSSDYNLDSKIFIIEGVSTKTLLQREHAIQIDISNLGKKGNVVWGDNNFLNNDIAYILLNDSHKIVKIQLGKSSDLGLGEMATTYKLYNGTYKILNTYTWGDIDTDYDNCVQGACYFKNKLIWGFGHNQGAISLHMAEFYEDFAEFTGVNYYQYSPTGEKLTGTVLGVTKYKDKLLVQTGDRVFVCNI